MARRWALSHKAPNLAMGSANGNGQKRKWQENGHSATGIVAPNGEAYQCGSQSW